MVAVLQLVGDNQKRKFFDSIPSKGIAAAITSNKSIIAQVHTDDLLRADNSMLLYILHADTSVGLTIAVAESFRKSRVRAM